MTHNVELVLPGAYYLVRMLDGRIDTQGTVEQLRAQGILDAIAHDSSLERQPEVMDTQPDTKQSREEDEDKSRKPRQLVKDEARETGSVKWRIYKTYMKASSYWTWAVLTFLICAYQVLVVIEKLWIKQWGDVSNPITSDFVNHLSDMYSIGLQPHGTCSTSLGAVFHYSRRRGPLHPP